MQITQQSDSRKLFEGVVGLGLDPGTIYSYDQLSELIEKPIQKNRTPLYLAIRLLEKHHNRTLVCMTGSGYRVAHSNEVRDIADGRVKKAESQVRRGIHTVSHTDMSTLTQEERRQLDQTRAGMLALKRQMSQISRQMKQHEVAIETHEASISSHDARLEWLVEEVNRLREEREQGG